MSIRKEQPRCLLVDSDVSDLAANGVVAAFAAGL